MKPEGFASSNIVDHDLILRVENESRLRLEQHRRCRVGLWDNPLHRPQRIDTHRPAMASCEKTAGNESIIRVTNDTKLELALPYSR